MNHEHRHVANSILSRLKDGEEFSRSVVNQALRDTGDIAPSGSSCVDKDVQTKESENSIRMVAENLVRLSEKAWTSRR